MCGGSGGDPGAQARQQEADRQARIRAATNTINGIFNNEVTKTGTRRVEVPQSERSAVDNANAMNDYWGMMSGGMFATDPIPSLPQFRDESYSYQAAGDPANSREVLYGDLRKDVYALNERDVNRQAEDAARANRFGLARTGLLGGSVDVDSNSKINELTNEGLLRAGSIADASAADFKLADERLRSNLISMAQSGIDTGSAATMALNGLQANADSTAGARAGATVGGLFDNLGYAYLANQQRQGINGAVNPYADQWIGVSGTRSGDSGTVVN